MGSKLDPISLEIISNSLRSIADECFVALMRSSYSTNIKERKDHSIAIVDRNGSAGCSGGSHIADPHRLNGRTDAVCSGEI